MSSQVPPFSGGCTGVKREHSGARSPEKHARRIDPQLWDRLKPDIERLHPDLTVSQLMEAMKEHGFSASKAQYRRQLRKWGLHKNRSPTGSGTSNDTSNANSPRKPEWNPSCCAYDSIADRGPSSSKKRKIPDLHSILGGKNHESECDDLISSASKSGGHGRQSDNPDWLSAGSQSHNDFAVSGFLLEHNPDHSMTSHYQPIQGASDPFRHNWFQFGKGTGDESSRNRYDILPSTSNPVSQTSNSASRDSGYNSITDKQSNYSHVDELVSNFIQESDNGIKSDQKYDIMRSDGCLDFYPHDLASQDSVHSHLTMPGPDRWWGKDLWPSFEMEMSPTNRPIPENTKANPNLTNPKSVHHNRSDSSAHVRKDLMQPVNQNPRVYSLITSDAIAMSPASIVERNSLSKALRLDDDFRVSSNSARAEILTPTEGDYDDIRELGSWSGDQSRDTSVVDLSDDESWSALDRFLDWANKYNIPQLVSHFNERTRPTPSEPAFTSHAAGGGGPQDTFVTNNDSVPTSLRATDSQKGKRQFDSANGLDDQELQVDKQGLKSHVAQKSIKPRLACHFHKRNPLKFSRGSYKTCPLGFNELKKLKEHQDYVHKRSHYCSRCQTIFRTRLQEDEHHTQPTRCESALNPEFADYLITDLQRAALKKKKPIGTTDERFWFEMWDKYFPGETRPDSAFQDLDPTLAAFQSFAAHESMSIMQAFNAYEPDHGLDLAQLTFFWEFAIDHAVANFARQRTYRVSSSPPSLPPTPALSQQRQTQLGAGFSESAFLELDTIDPAWLFTE